MTIAFSWSFTITIKNTLSLFALIILLSGCQHLVSPIAGNFNPDIKEAKEDLSKEARALIDHAFLGLEDKCLFDFHVHAIGLGNNNNGTWVNPKMLSLWHPGHYFKYLIYSSASGISMSDESDQLYIERLVKLKRSEPRYPRMGLLAFDYFHDENGSAIKDKSTFYIPNDYILKVAKKYPDVFEPVGSVHPYRDDATKQLKKLAKAGVKVMKWLPNSQHIDPSHPKTKKYYEVMAANDMILMTHTGDEKAVEGEEFQKLGNPLLLRSALDAKVKVIMAHMASLGTCDDFDNNNAPISCEKLVWRILDNPKYKGLAFGEISGTTIHTRFDKSIKNIMERTSKSPAIVNGSDYPLPAINILYRTSQYHEMGHITDSERKSLNEIYQFNPLLFDFVIKRTLRHPKTKQKLSDKIFTDHNLIGCKK